MCSLVGSFNKDKLKELILLNQHRGNFSYSFTVIQPKLMNHHSIKHLGEFDFNIFNESGTRDNYKLVHVQAPTGINNSEATIHPAEYQDYKLWHNGILQPNQIKKLQEGLKDNSTWDTHLLLKAIAEKGIDVVDDIEGSFACILLKQGKWMKIFRTTSAPLFVDSDFNLSSVKFPNSEMIKDGKVYKVNLLNRTWEPDHIFKPKDNPYFF